MKKIFITVLLIFLALPIFSKPSVEKSLPIEYIKPLESNVTFDWISKTQIQRDENIKQIQNILFSEKRVLKYSKQEFKKKYSDFWKNKNYLNDYEEILKGKKEDADKYYCGFFLKKLLIAYGVQYKKNMSSIFYYDAMGNLKFVDVFSDNYPKFPYWSYQYGRNGKIIGAFYYVSDYDQYIFNPDKKFAGRWYKENMYNKNAKIILTRSNY